MTSQCSFNEQLSQYFYTILIIVCVHTFCPFVSRVLNIFPSVFKCSLYVMVSPFIMSM